MKIKFGIDQIRQIVKEHLLPKLKEFTIFTFTGPLGAGKTTLIKTFLKECGVKDVVTSPTFTYVNIYKTKEGKVFYHFDLYRLRYLQNFLNSGFDEYFNQDEEEKKYILVEWPGIIKPFLDQESIKQAVCSVILDYVDDDLQNRILQI